MKWMKLAKSRSRLAMRHRGRVQALGNRPHVTAYAACFLIRLASTKSWRSLILQRRSTAASGSPAPIDHSVFSFRMRLSVVRGMQSASASRTQCTLKARTFVAGQHAVWTLDEMSGYSAKHDSLIVENQSTKTINST
jgi:hypothetical protein